MDNIDFIKQLEKIHKGVNKIMEKATVDYNTFLLEDGFEIYYSENGKEIFGKLFWDKKNKQL